MLTIRPSFGRDALTSAVSALPVALAIEAFRVVAPRPVPVLVFAALVPYLLSIFLGNWYLNTFRIDAKTVRGPMQGVRLGWFGTVSRSHICGIRSSRRTLLDYLMGQTRIWTRDGARIVINHSAFNATERRRILAAAGIREPATRSGS